MTERLLVEVPDADSALSLVDEFKDLHAELIPIDGGRCEVQVELERDRERQLLAALAAVERWLASSGIEATRVKLGERSYTVERPGSSAATAASRSSASRRTKFSSARSTKGSSKPRRMPPSRV